MQQIRFRLNISAEQLLEYYRGSVSQVSVVAADGRRVRFPANVLRPFISEGGVRGEFILQYDDNNRFSGIRRIG